MAGAIRYLTALQVWGINQKVLRVAPCLCCLAASQRWRIELMRIA